MSVAECQRKVSSREFAEWVALNEIEPWNPSTVPYLVAGIIAAQVNNSFQMFVKTSQRKRMKPSDYVPEWPEATLPELEASDSPIETSDAETMLAKASLIFMALGGIDTTKGQPN